MKSLHEPKQGKPLKKLFATRHVKPFNHTRGRNVNKHFLSTITIDMIIDSLLFLADGDGEETIVYDDFARMIFTPEEYNIFMERYEKKFTYAYDATEY